MTIALNRDKIWTPEIWAEIDKAVQAEAALVRVAQKMLPTTLIPDASTIPDEVIDFQTLRMADDKVKPVIEVSRDFLLTPQQADGPARLTLARLAAKDVALAEDRLLFHGRNAELPAELKVNKSAAGDGLLAAAKLLHTVKSEPALAAGIYAGVVRLTLQLGAKGQPGLYGFFGESSVIADASEPGADSLVTAADRMAAVASGGFLPTGALSTSVPGAVRKSLVISLAGEPVMIYLLQDIVTGFVQTDTDGTLRCRVLERFQYVVREPNALGRLDTPATPAIK